MFQFQPYLLRRRPMPARDRVFFTPTQYTSNTLAAAPGRHYRIVLDIKYFSYLQLPSRLAIADCTVPSARPIAETTLHPPITTSLRTIHSHHVEDVGGRSGDEGEGSHPLLHSVAISLHPISWRFPWHIPPQRLILLQWRMLTCVVLVVVARNTESQRE